MIFMKILSLIIIVLKIMLLKQGEYLSVYFN